jgi:UDP-glucose:glycoprotein glucosyltransferase
LVISGYGVELALKRTDYIVIDDRDGRDTNGESKTEESSASHADPDPSSDLKPLSTSELRQLGLKTSSFVLDCDTPFDTLLQISQDFPQYSSKMAAHNVSEEFLAEHRTNRETLLPEGTNVVWINGAQVEPRHLNAFALSHLLRRERQLVGSLMSLGLSSQDAVRLLSHSEIAASSDGDEVQRYDWRDEAENGGVILWLNDLEKDTRYKSWPKAVNAVSTWCRCVWPCVC